MLPVGRGSVGDKEEEEEEKEEEERRERGREGGGEEREREEEERGRREGESVVCNLNIHVTQIQCLSFTVNVLFCIFRRQVLIHGDMNVASGRRGKSGMDAITTSPPPPPPPPPPLPLTQTLPQTVPGV